MKRWIAFLPLLVLGLLAVLFATFGLHHDPHVTPAALVGKPLPGDRLPPLAGGQTTPLTATVQGPTLINVFFSTCAPCVEEHPTLLALKARGVRLVGIAYKEPEERSRAYLDRNGNPFAVVLADRDGSASLDLGVSGAPETFAVTASGKIVAKHSGILTAADANELIRAAITGTR